MSVDQDEDKGTDGIRRRHYERVAERHAGASVGYQVIAPCGIINAQSGPFGDVCFQGNLNIMPGS